MSAFYNENEPYAAEWLKNLSFQGHIAPGLVDDRSIVDLTPEDVGEGQAHFFAGIGGWSYALRLAGWPDDVPVWTGSCPCQPFSQAGRGRGTKDERHLWPVWFKLIEKCRPPVVFGEQVGSPAGLKWLDAVYVDLEGAGYTVGAADLCAASVGAPHIRQRLYFVAFSREQRREGQRVHLRPGQSRSAVAEAPRSGEARELGDAGRARGGRDAGAIFGEETESSRERIEARDLAHKLGASGAASIVGDAGSSRSPFGSGSEERFGAIRHERSSAPAPGATRGFWADAEWIPCRDGKARPVEPGSFPLAYGVPARVGKLRAYGNAIVPELAATFIRAAMNVGSAV